MLCVEMPDLARKGISTSCGAEDLLVHLARAGGASLDPFLSGELGDTTGGRCQVFLLLRGGGGVEAELAEEEGEAALGVGGDTEVDSLLTELGEEGGVT